MDTKELFKAYSFNVIAEAIRVFKKLEKAGMGIADLLAYEEENRKGRAAFVDARNKELQTARGRKRRKEAVNKGNRKAKPPYLAPGQGEFLKGLKCGKCGADIYYEALCGKTSAKKKCIRIATCVECNTEVKIR